LKTNYHILIIFSTNILDTTCDQMTNQFPTSPNICFCITWGKHNQRNITFFIKCDMIAHFVHISDTLAGISCHPVVHFSTACSKTAWSVGISCEHKQGDAFSIHWQQYR